jgi:hypothetical protein
MQRAIAGIGFVLCSLFAGPTHAASLSFSMDFDLRCDVPACLSGPFSTLKGPFEDAGSFTLDETLLSSTGQTLIDYGQVQDFALSFPAPFFTFDTASLVDGLCFDAACGMLFTGSRFDGFVGEFVIADDALTSMVRFLPGNAINLDFIVSTLRDPNCTSLQCTSFITDGIASSGAVIKPGSAPTPTPEPASWLLLGAGGALVRWRTRKSVRAPSTSGTAND